jgi:hypothetical protein
MCRRAMRQPQQRDRLTGGVEDRLREFFRIAGVDTVTGARDEFPKTLGRRRVVVGVLLRVLRRMVRTAAGIAQLAYDAEYLNGSTSALCAHLAQRRSGDLLGANSIGLS